ncbi:glycosyltransferase [Kineothrix sp. MB12-C1]|uniref:glycosyltransferase n=1 Tax=Kineothrix sp. MB12-C1 TaxID=3070215 RepID=UPI0027D26CA6|nr:glycosyltransferase [Kineothrix sp. MB12-C1]WMC91688.1 glycosyltransferase [Kineothrix sp. MB12-C1]
MKKVIFVIVSMAGGGAERVISILANQFARQNIEVTILMTAGDTVSYHLDEKIRLISAGGVSGGSLKLRWKRICKMREVFRANRDATIISFGPGTSFFAVIADLFLGNRMIISERNDPAVCPYPHLRNLIYHRGHKLVFQTEDAKACFPKYLRNKGVVIPNPIEEGLPSPYRGERKKTVVSVGRLEPQKNHMLLLEAFAEFHEHLPEYTLHLYGDGSLKKDLEEHAELLGIQSVVVFEGFTKNVTNKIKDAGMYVLSSDYEGISNSLLEAMATGIPSISTDCPIGGSRLCIESYENGILVKIGDREGLMKAMYDIASSEVLAVKLSENGAKLKEKYSERSIAEIWQEII